MDVFHMRVSEVERDDVRARYREVLAADEIERMDAFVDEGRRLEYLATRVLCRGILARHLSCRPRDLRFRRNPMGRPELDSAGDLRFSLSNTARMVVCAVTCGRELGVDAEDLASASRVLALGGDAFAASELDALARLDGPVRDELAVRLWTVKEAYVKAVGLGLRIPLTDVVVDPGSLTLEDPRARAGWELGTRRVDDHVVATCVERLGDVAPRVVVHEVDAPTLLGL